MYNCLSIYKYKNETIVCGLGKLQYFYLPLKWPSCVICWRKSISNLSSSVYQKYISIRFNTLLVILIAYDCVYGCVYIIISWCLVKLLYKKHKNHVQLKCTDKSALVERFHDTNHVFTLKKEKVLKKNSTSKHLLY